MKIESLKTRFSANELFNIIVLSIMSSEEFTQGSDKHCEAMHFKQFDLTFHMLQHTISIVSVIF